LLKAIHVKKEDKLKQKTQRKTTDGEPGTEDAAEDSASITPIERPTPT
jgi:hypothetical protein